jgi:putative addiction module killer protein
VTVLRHPQKNRGGSIEIFPSVNYSSHMVEVLQTEEFEAWLEGLRDRKARMAIAKRILRVQSGLLGDVEPVGDGISEMRIHYGPGYRLYFTKRQSVLIILLCGGNKSSQVRDIARAKQLAKEV